MQGDFSRVKRIGEGMKAGSMEIDGRQECIWELRCLGKHTGKGNAGSWPGREMKGGLLHIKGIVGTMWAQPTGEAGGA